MNKPIRGVEATLPAEEQVAEFLVAHPEFFERHGSVLARLQLPHQRGSAAVSLVERQVLVLREKHGALEKKLLELIEYGRANDAIADRVHRLTRRLLRARDAAGCIAALETSLREDFGASRWVLLRRGSGRRDAGGPAERSRSRRAARQRRSCGSSSRSSSRPGRAAARSATRSATISSAATAARSARPC